MRSSCSIRVPVAAGSGGVFSLCCRALGYTHDMFSTGQTTFGQRCGRKVRVDGCTATHARSLATNHCCTSLAGVKNCLTSWRLGLRASSTDPTVRCQYGGRLTREGPRDESWLRDRFSEINARLRSATDVVRLAVLIRRDASECAELEAAVKVAELARRRSRDEPLEASHGEPCVESLAKPRRRKKWK